MKKKTAVRSNVAKSNGGETHQTVLGDTLLTTNQGLALSDNQNSLKAGGRAPLFSKILSCARKSRISTMSASRNGSSMRGDPPPMDTSSLISP